MDIEAIQKVLHDGFGAAVGSVEKSHVSTWIEVEPARIAAVCQMLKERPELAFDSLSNLSGCDYPATGKIQIVYDLYSYTHDHSVTLKVDTEREAPSVPTVERVWRAANWLEREVYDLLGVDFPGNHDLRRILLPDDWIGHPLRKDYVEQPDYHGISTHRESILNIPTRH